MENKKRALGKGLEQLFDMEKLENMNIPKIEKDIYKTTALEEVEQLDLNELRPNPYQPRKEFDEDALNELAESIKQNGVFQPIIAKKTIKGYEIIAGERRVRASKKAGLETIPAIVREFTDEQMIEIALLENLQRENLNPLEEANAYKNMLDKLNLTQEELAQKVGKSRSHITNTIGILRLPVEIQNQIADTKISMAHARILSKFESEQEIKKMAKQIIDKGISVRELEKLAENTDKKIKIVRKKQTNEYKYIEDVLMDKFDAKIKIKDKKIEISFVNNADLNRILEIINIKER